MQDLRRHAAARSISYLGPRRSHIGELVDELAMGWQIEHGDVGGALTVLPEVAAMPEAGLRERGERARRGLTARLSQARLVGELCDLLEGNVVAGGPG